MSWNGWWRNTTSPKEYTLPGNVDRMATLFESSNIFCMPSKWEGFPNAVAEALAAGLPVVGYAECAGLNQLVVSGYNGVLAEGNGDVASLRDALARLMDDAGLRAKMGSAGRESMKAYEPALVFSRWEKLLFGPDAP